MENEAKPRRVQLRRTKGWRMPENTVSVARPGKWGNPFKIGEIKFWSQDGSPTVVTCPQTIQECVDLFRWLVTQASRPVMIADELRGKNLACWCPLNAPCHADVLLELANTPTEATPHGE